MADNSFEDILTKVVSERGIVILDTPAKCNSILQDYANGGYKREIHLLLQALEVRYHKELLTSTDPEITKPILVKKFHDDYGIAIEAAEETINVLATVLFGEEKQLENNCCKNCGKELQKEWIVCPYCATSTIKQDVVLNPEVGRIYKGTVKRIMDYGAFVEIMPGKEGLLHISKLSRQRKNSVTDVIKEWQKIPVLLTNIDKEGRLNLSYIDAIESLEKKIISVVSENKITTLTKEQIISQVGSDYTDEVETLLEKLVRQGIL